MKHLLLTVSFQQSAARLGQTAVEIPLDVGNICVVHYLFYAIKKIIAHIRTAHIKHILIACNAHVPVGRLQSPLGMLAEQLAVP